MKNKKIFLIVGIVLLALLASITGASWNLSITGQQPGDLVYVGAGGLIDVRHVGTQGQVLTVNNGLPIWSTPDTSNGTPFSGNITFPISTADNILYKNSLGYHAIRTIDGHELSTSSDGAVCWNNMCALIRTYYKPSDPNMYDSETNPNGYKEGRRIYVTCPELFCGQTLVIPPVEDQYIDFGKCVIQGLQGVTRVVSIDCWMCSEIRLGIVCDYTGTTNSELVYISPHTVSTDGYTVGGTSTIYIEALVSTSTNANGVKLVVPAGGIGVIGTDFIVNEVNVGTNNSIGIHVLSPGTSSAIHNNYFRVKLNNSSSKLFVIENTLAVYMNIINLAVYDSTAIIINGNTSEPQNTITTTARPTTNPHVRGQEWLNNGVVTVSGG